MIGIENTLSAVDLRSLLASATTRNIDKVVTEIEDHIDTIDDHNNDALPCSDIVEISKEKYQESFPTIAQVAGDGHCIIHSWKVGLENAGVPVSHAHHLLDAAIDEIVENINFYQDFVDGDMMEQLTEYRSLGMYQSEVVDMMLYALANATRISCDVLSVRDDRVQTISITPRGEQPNTTIKVFKLGAHYDGVAHVENSKEGRYQNNSALLHSVPIVGLAMPIQSVLSG